jgi:hypothetical protein
VNIGVPELLIVFAIAVLAVVPLVLGLIVAIDASRFPDSAFERAGTAKTLWIVLPIASIFVCGPVAIVAAIVWYSSFRRRVIDAAQGGAPAA